jgi:putative transposase
MPKQKPQLVNEEIYHIVLRSVGDTAIFLNEDDYYRGIFSIYEFNNAKSVEIWLRRLQRKKEKVEEKALGGLTSQYSDKRDCLVKIFAFSFMPNHIHLLVRQLKDNGISQFMRKLGTGYAVYFNKRYKRKGHLFNTFHAVLVETDDQLENVFAYIHSNRISMIEPGWKENGIKDSQKVVNFLENDKWHSYPDYLGKNNFNSVTSREFMLELMGGSEGCRDFINMWVNNKKLGGQTSQFLE